MKEAEAIVDQENIEEGILTQVLKVVGATKEEEEASVGIGITAEEEIRGGEIVLLAIQEETIDN